MLPKAFRRVREINDKEVIFDATISCDYGGECGKLQCFEAGICVGGMRTKAELQPKELPPLEEIQRLVRTMPYGDVVAMAEGIGADPAKLWGWATRC